MKIDWNKKYTTISVYAFLVICASIIFFSIIGEIDAFTTKLGWVVSTLQPFIIGFVMAYLFNFILVFYEEKVLVFDLVKSDLFTQLAHPDTIKMFNYYPKYDLTETYHQLAKLLIEHNVIAENNTGCHYRYNHRDIGLSDELLKIFKEHNVKLIVASDAHHPEHVGTNIIDIYEKTMK